MCAIVTLPETLAGGLLGYGGGGSREGEEQCSAVHDSI